MNDKANELKTQFQLFQEIPFPLDSSDEELSMLHAELADFDGYAAGLLESIVTGRTGKGQELKYDQKLEDKIRNALRRKEDKDLFLADQYLRYILVIKRLFDLAKNV